MRDLCFNSLAPLIINKTPDATPVVSTQIPSTRLEIADAFIALYNFSFMKKSSFLIFLLLFILSYNTKIIQ